MDDMYVVWYSAGNPSVPGWMPSESMNREEAENYADRLENGGYQTLIHPRHRVSQMDLVEG